MEAMHLLSLLLPAAQVRRSERPAQPHDLHTMQNAQALSKVQEDLEVEEVCVNEATGEATRVD
jgi:hypothetical protein